MLFWNIIPPKVNRIFNVLLHGRRTFGASDVLKVAGFEVIENHCDEDMFKDSFML